jgi:hypothetical protein
MPKPKRTESKPNELPEVDATRRLLLAMQDIERLNKFRLAAIVMWIRGEWRGESEVLADVDGALKLIDAMTTREARQAIDAAASVNLRAAVTS